MAGRIMVAGVGMIPFRKPGAAPAYTVMGAQAARTALADAGVGYESVQQAFVSYVHGDSSAGQRVLYDLGLTGIPVVNVRNGGSGGSAALYLARQAIASGEADITLVLGFEQLSPDEPAVAFADHPDLLELRTGQRDGLVAGVNLPTAVRVFGSAGLEHMRRYGTPLATFAKIRAKASRHAASNPLAVQRQLLSVADVLGDQPVWPGVMTRSMACTPACGAAAAVLCSEEYAKTHGLGATVWIAAQAICTEGPARLGPEDARDGAGYSMSRAAALRTYEMAGISPLDVDVIELHDCFAQNELLSYEALGLCAEGGAQALVDADDTTYGGRCVVNPSGGLLANGHPMGATGLAQCHELALQLRGRADRRQVPGARIALQHNVGFGGGAVVTIYRN